VELGTLRDLRLDKQKSRERVDAIAAAASAMHAVMKHPPKRPDDFFNRLARPPAWRFECPRCHLIIPFHAPAEVFHSSAVEKCPSLVPSGEVQRQKSPTVCAGFEPAHRRQATQASPPVDLPCGIPGE